MNKFGAIILAGGQSRRMGTDKTALKIGKITMLERLLKNLSSVVSEVVVMSNKTQRLAPTSPFGQNLILAKDTENFQGPLRGIADALPFLRQELNFIFILSCDLPYLTSENLENMKCFLKPEADVVCAENDGILNPLLSIWRKEALLPASRLLKEGKRSPFDLWRDKKIVSLHPPSENPLAYSDANTPEAFEKALKFHKAR